MTVKYYHPSIARGNYNWDHELLIILPQIVKCESSQERNNVLLHWIDRLESFEILEEQLIDSASIKMEPDYIWINTSQLGADLVKRLNGIKKAKRESNHFYVAFDSLLTHPQFKNEAAYSEMTYPGAGYRLLSLFRYWNVIQYFYPYKYLIGDSWHNVLEEFIPKFFNASNELEYQLAILQLIAQTQDSHGGIYSNEIIENFKGKYCAPIEVTFIEGKPVVTDFLGQGLKKKTGLQIGDIIEAVNGRNVDEIVDERLPFVSASNYAVQMREIAWDFLRAEDSVIIINYQRNGVPGKSKVVCFPWNQINVYQRLLFKDSCFTMLTPDIAYLNPWTIRTESIPKIMESVVGTKGFIIDLRYAPRESLYPLGDLFFSEPQVFAIFTKGSLQFPGLFTFFKRMEIGKINEKSYTGKVVILNNEYTQSSAEFTTMAFRKASNATIIGSRTAGADGAVSEFNLPGGIRTVITGSGVYYPDGAETQRVGIIPDIEIRPTIKGIKENRDELLERAIELIQN
jgi:hypothetical protein